MIFGKRIQIISIFFILIICIACTAKTKEINVNDDFSIIKTNADHLGEPYKLKLVYIGTPQIDEQLVEQEASKYLKDKLNATLDIIVLDWGSWDNRQNILIASREEFDVIFTSQWSRYSINVSKGAFLPLNQLLHDYGQDILQALDPLIVESAKIDGVSYGVPSNKEFASQGGIIYRKDIAQQLNLDMANVQSIEDLDSIYAVLRREKPEMIPLYIKYGENLNSHYINNYDALGDTSIPGYILKDENSTIIRPLYEIPRYLDNLYLARTFYLKGYVNKDAATTQMMVGDALSSNEYFSIISPLKPGKAEEIAIQTGLSGKLAQIPLNQKSLATSETTGAMLAISSTSKNPVLAMKFINMLHTDVYLNNLINFGVEGIHYEKVADGVISVTEKTSRYSPGSNWMLGNQFINYLWDTEAPDKWQQFRDFNADVVISPGLGFVFDGESVKSEVAAVVNVDKQYLMALESGSVDPESVMPEYIKKLKIAGIDKIISAKQEQFDQFLLNKSMKNIPQ